MAEGSVADRRRMRGLALGWPLLCAASVVIMCFFFFFSSRRRHTRWNCDWSSDVCSSDLELPVIVFDVNETLLDIESLTPTFERIFGDRLALRRWFAELILYSEALTLAGIYVPFTDIGGAVLKMLATTCGIAISAADRAELTEKFASMPAHPDVPDALLKLKRAGFRLCTLTNNTAEI